MLKSSLALQSHLKTLTKAIRCWYDMIFVTPPFSKFGNPKYDLCKQVHNLTVGELPKRILRLSTRLS
jgi:hypothetical protein